MEVNPIEKTENNLVLCYLADEWQSRVSDGPKNKGQVIFYKYGITANNFEWQLTEFRKDSLYFIRVHASCFAQLVPSFKTEAGLDALKCMIRCQQALENVVKINPNLKPIPGCVDIYGAIDFAEQVDLAYQTNYTLHNNVRERFFGEGSDDTEE